MHCIFLRFDDFKSRRGSTTGAQCAAKLGETFYLRRGVFVNPFDWSFHSSSFLIKSRRGHLYPSTFCVNIYMRASIDDPLKAQTRPITTQVKLQPADNFPGAFNSTNNFCLHSRRKEGAPRVNYFIPRVPT